VQQAGNVGGVVLQVGVEGDDDVVAGGVDAGGHGGGLAEIAAEADQAEMGIGAGGLDQAVPRGVARAVVDQQNLVAAPQSGERVVEFLRQVGDVVFLVVNGNHDGQAGRGGCHSGSMGDGRGQFKRGLRGAGDRTNASKSSDPFNARDAMDATDPQTPEGEIEW